MTAKEKEQYIRVLKERGQVATKRADSLLADLATESAKLKTSTKSLHNALTEELASRPDRETKNAT